MILVSSGQKEFALCHNGEHRPTLNANVIYNTIPHKYYKFPHFKIINFNS